TVEIRSPLRFYQTVRRTFTVPMPNVNVIDASSTDPNKRNPMLPYSVDLDPGHTYPFPDSYPFQVQANPVPCGSIAPGSGPTLLRGGLHAVDGTGIEGARVEVVGVSNVFETGDTGDWVLWFPEAQPSGLVTVRVTPPASAASNVSGVCMVRGREASLHETSLRGWVRRRGLGVGDAEILVGGFPGSSRTAADGSWSYYFGLDQPDQIVGVTAVLPDGP